jgi:mannitol-1-phosphate 5-dehydrogenase
MMQRKILIFGAGKIGRAFIGQVFGRAGYEVVFVDIDRGIIDQLNQKRQYRVEIKDQVCETLIIKNVSGVQADDIRGIKRELMECDLLAVSVGQSGMPSVAVCLAKALEHKYHEAPHRATDIILAENMRDASSYFAARLSTCLPSGFPLPDRVGLIESSIGKMVPVMPGDIAIKDPLMVWAEAYNTLILDGVAFKNPVPHIKDLAPKSNIRAWVDRKLFLHNLGHAMAAYFGNYYRPDLGLMFQVLTDRRVAEKTLRAMFEAGEVLMKLYPGVFTRDEIEAHISELFDRFKNPYLGDTVHRVGCDLKRKLGPDDRIAIPIRYAKDFGLSYQTMLEGYKCALNFSACDEKGGQLGGDLELKGLFQEKGLEYMLVHFSGLILPD